MKIVAARYTPGICDWSGCNNKAASYIMLASGAVHLCRKHAAQQRLARRLSLMPNKTSKAPSTRASG